MTEKRIRPIIVEYRTELIFHVEEDLTDEEIRKQLDQSCAFRAVGQLVRELTLERRQQQMDNVPPGQAECTLCKRGTIAYVGPATAEDVERLTPQALWKAYQTYVLKTGSVEEIKEVAGATPGEDVEQSFTPWPKGDSSSVRVSDIVGPEPPKE